MSSENVMPPNSDAWLGWIRAGCGSLLLVCGLAGASPGLVFVAIADGSPLKIVGSLALALSSLLAIAWGCVLSSRGLRLRTRPASWVMASDPRRPVVYLRSFLDDEHTANEQALRAQELTLVHVFDPLGPVVTVADPGASRPWFGVPRLVLGNEWQQTVTDLVDRAALVMVRTGFTPGLFWEVREVVKKLDPTRFMLLVDDHEGDYAYFTERLRDVFPCFLPPLTGKDLGRSLIRGVISFRADWVPSYTACSNSVGLHYALWRACGHLGLRWRWWSTYWVALSWRVFLWSAIPCGVLFLLIKSSDEFEFLGFPALFNLAVAVLSFWLCVTALCRAVKERLSVRTVQ